MNYLLAFLVGSLVSAPIWYHLGRTNRPVTNYYRLHVPHMGDMLPIPLDDEYDDWSLDAERMN